MAFLKSLIPGAIALLGPPIVLFCYLSLGRRGQREVYDDLVLVVPVALGLIPLNCYKLRWFFRVPLNVIYFAGMILLDFSLALGFVCGMYHSCL